MKQRIALWLAFCAVLGVAVFACVPRLFLTAEDETGKVVFLRPVYEGDRYAVRFIHSVARRPVDEIYEIAPDASVLRETIYDMTGAGLPYQPEAGQTFSIENGKYVIRGFDVRIPALTYRISKVVADHTLLIGGDEIRLRDLVSSPGKPLTFRVRRMTPAEAFPIWRELRARKEKGE